MSCTSSPSYIMTPESDVESPYAISAFIQGHHPRIIIRHLLEYYGKEQISHLLEEEASPKFTGHARALETIPNPALYTSGIDGLPCRTSSFDHKDMTQPGPTFGPWNTVPNNSSDMGSRRQSLTEKPSSALSSSHRLDYACGFCAEEGIRKTCTRRNDLRRHIENFHNKNAVWFCQHPGCEMAYDWQGAYQMHLKTAHGRSHMNVDEAMVKICPQTVFACGFEGCTEVYEIPSEAEAASTLKRFSGHVVKHFEEGSYRAAWSYSTRLRNLLRQSKVVELWEKAWPDLGRACLQWDTQSTLAARKTLEAGHLENLPFLIRQLIAIGTRSRDAAHLVGQLDLPIRERCPGPVGNSLPYNVTAQSPPLDAERDTTQFKIAGGLSLGYRPYENLPHGQQHIPRSIEPYNVEGTVDGNNTQSRGHFGDEVVASLRSISPPRLFYAHPGPSLYSQSPVMVASALEPHQQAAGRFVAMVREGESISSTASFHGSHQLAETNITSGMDVDMVPGATDTGRGTLRLAGENWMTQYQQTPLAMLPSSPVEGYTVSHNMAPENIHMTGRYGSSPAGSL